MNEDLGEADIFKTSPPDSPLSQGNDTMDSSL